MALITIGSVLIGLGHHWLWILTRSVLRAATPVIRFCR